VERLCYKCGASVEEGTAFCPQCSAPQIRVGGLAVEPTTAQPDVSQGQPATISDSPRIEWAQAVPAAALAGLAAAFLMFIPLGAFGLGMVAAGVLAVLFYRRRNPGGRLTPGMGARLGAVSGVFGFGMCAVLMAIDVAVFHGGETLREAMLQAIQQSAARSSDPQVQQMLDYFKSPAGMVLMLVATLAIAFVAFLVFSSLGGAIGAVMLRRKDQE